MATKTIDLNTASAEELREAVPQLDETKAQALIESRPFQTWDEVKIATEFEDSLIQDMKENGIMLGQDE